MSKTRIYRYQPRPDAAERIRSAGVLIKGLALMLRAKLDVIVAEHRSGILSESIWKLTEAETGSNVVPNDLGSGKYGLRYCTESVWMNRNKLRGDLHHEHVNPIRNLRNALLTCDMQDIDRIIEGKIIACVVDKDDHPRKQVQVDTLDGWKRYKDNSIRVVDALKTKDPNNPYFVPETR
jgi:hypothetical protein